MSAKNILPLPIYASNNMFSHMSISHMRRILDGGISNRLFNELLKSQVESFRLQNVSEIGRYCSGEHRTCSQKIQWPVASETSSTCGANDRITSACIDSTATMSRLAPTKSTGTFTVLPTSVASSAISTPSTCDLYTLSGAVRPPVRSDDRVTLVSYSSQLIMWL